MVLNITVSSIYVQRIRWLKDMVRYLIVRGDPDAIFPVKHRKGLRIILRRQKHAILAWEGIDEISEVARPWSVFRYFQLS
jgi:hypothetical protein